MLGRTHLLPWNCQLGCQTGRWQVSFATQTIPTQEISRRLCRGEKRKGIDGFMCLSSAKGVSGMHLSSPPGEGSPREPLMKIGGLARRD